MHVYVANQIAEVLEEKYRKRTWRFALIFLCIKKTFIKPANFFFFSILSRCIEEALSQSNCRIL